MSNVAMHYGIVHGIVGNEGEGIGNLSVSAILDPSPNMPQARIVVGSTVSSETDLGQFVLTREQGRSLIALLGAACTDLDCVPTDISGGHP